MRRERNVPKVKLSPRTDLAVRQLKAWGIIWDILNETKTRLFICSSTDRSGNRKVKPTSAMYIKRLNDPNYIIMVNAGKSPQFTFHRVKK